MTITGYPSYNFKIHQMYTDKKQVLSDDGMFLDYQVDTLEGLVDLQFMMLVTA